ncbi:hypothetical protein PBN151_1427 [Paenibacillus sp. NAIST15-1]|nr:hypothetical protein PBN151_1427 [Paenibacillus sp. NAIST15-1]
MWDRLEQRGRLELGLNDEWYLYAADLNESDCADLMFARKNENIFLAKNTVSCSVTYFDLRD